MLPSPTTENGADRDATAYFFSAYLDLLDELACTAGAGNGNGTDAGAGAASANDDPDKVTEAAKQPVRKTKPSRKPRRRSTVIKKDDHLYTDILYTIKHKIGKAIDGHLTALHDLYDYSKDSFAVSDSEHHRLLMKVAREKPPRVVLNVTVVEARGLEAKDSNGYSDPYCMLGIVPGECRRTSVFEDCDEPLPLPPLPTSSALLAVSRSPAELRRHSVDPTANDSDTPKLPDGRRLRASDDEDEEREDQLGGLGFYASSRSSMRRVTVDVDKISLGPDKSALRKFGESVRKRCGKMRSRSATAKRGSDAHCVTPRAANSSCGSPATSIRDLSSQDLIPAKSIKTTSVKARTTAPHWGESFRLDIDDLNADMLHLDVWDHDDESNVLDAVRHLNQVKGVKGLRRYFKQVSQSARSKPGADVDDFLGCVNIKIADIPSNGVDAWYKLETRSARNRAQGEIHLKMQLGTREARGMTEEEEEVYLDFQQHERMLSIFTEYELKNRALKSKSEVSLWNGVLSNAAETILHQHKIQGELSDMQEVVCRWLVYSRLISEYPLSYEVLYNLLTRMNTYFKPGMLGKDELDTLQNSFSKFTRCAMDIVVDANSQFPITAAHPRRDAGMNNAVQPSSKQGSRSSLSSNSDRESQSSMSNCNTPNPVRRALPQHLMVESENSHARGHVPLAARRSAPLSPADGPIKEWNSRASQASHSHSRSRTDGPEKTEVDTKQLRRGSDQLQTSQTIIADTDNKKNTESLQNLAHFLRTLAFLHNMDLYSYAAPFTNQIQSDLTGAVKKHVQEVLEGLEHTISQSNDSPLRTLQELNMFLEALNRELMLARKYDEIFQREASFKYFATVHRFVLKEISVKIDARLQTSLNACCSVLHSAIPSSTVSVLSMLSPRIGSPRTPRAHTPLSSASPTMSVLATGSPDRPAAHSVCTSRVATPLANSLSNLQVPHASDPAVDKSDQTSSTVADECLIAHFKAIMKNYLIVKNVIALSKGHEAQLSDEGKEFATRLESALQWFTPAIHLWLSDLRRKLDAYVVTVADLLCAAPKKHVHTLASVYCDICEFWKSLLLHDMHGRLSFVFTITEILSDKAVRYSVVIQERLQSYDTSGNTADMTTACLNSVESMQQTLKRLADMLQFDLLYGKLVQHLQNEQQAKLTSNGLHELINNAVGKIDMSIGFIVNHIASKLRPDIKKYVFNVCWAPKGMPPEAAVGSLLNFVKLTATQMQTEVRGYCLVRVICGFWHQILAHFEEQVEKESAEIDASATRNDTPSTAPANLPSNPATTAANVPPTFLRVADSRTLNSLSLSPLTNRRNTTFGPTALAHTSAIASVRSRDSAYSSEHVSVTASVTSSIGLMSPAQTSVAHNNLSHQVSSGFTSSVAETNPAIEEALQTVTVICARLSVAVRLIFEHLYALCEKASTNGGEMLKSDLYRRMAQLLYLHQLPTTNVIEEYMEEFAHIQANTKESKYGQLTVRVVYKTLQCKLCVQVLHAKDLVPLDPNGLSDPFVIVELNPPHLFPNSQRYQTTVVKRSLSPVFEETFEIPIDVNVCRMRGAAILLTVMDYDMIFKNDFGGEACMLLRDVPGVNEAELSGFQSLKPVTLPVLHLKAQSAAIQVLQHRKHDRYAQDFARRRIAIAQQSFSAPTTSRQKAMMYL